MPIMTASSSCARHRRGFSLIEMAIAVFVIALLLGSILVPLQTQIETRRLEETRRLLDQARDALLGYVAAYGYFPCPASAASNGQEAVTSHASGACAAAVTGTNAYVGFLPAVTIGFTPVDGSGYAVDAWTLVQNRIRYAVANATVNGITNPFTRINGMRSAGMSNIAASTQLLYVCGTGSGVTGTGCAAAADQLSDDAIAVIWSLGPNAPTGGGSPHEDKNLDNDRVFVMRAQSNVAGAVFDDVVTWIAPPILFNRLVAAGQLP
jgi:prepilin-type N-terminal cleavage/methylation domain-containing protein